MRPPPATRRTDPPAPALSVVRNPLRSMPGAEAGPGAADAGHSADPSEGLTPEGFHARLGGYASTPLLDLPTTAAVLGIGRLFVKDESSRLGLPAFKMLGASWASYRSVECLYARVTGRSLPHWSDTGELARLLEPVRPLDLATATDGNHGRAVARFARLVGLGARIFVPEGTTHARIDAIVSEGARCSVVQDTYDQAVVRAAAEASDRCLVVSDTSWPGYETVPRWVIDGYSTIFSEIDAQRAGAGWPDPDVVVVPVGVGALACAVARWYRRPGLDHATVLVGVEPDTANCLMASALAGHLVEVPGPHRSVMAGLNCGSPSPVAWPWVSSGFDWFVAGGDDLATTGMRRLATEGVVSGESGACTVGALCALAAGAGSASGLVLPADAVVLALSTEGATDPDFYESVVGRTAGEVASVHDGARP